MDNTVRKLMPMNKPIVIIRGLQDTHRLWKFCRKCKRLRSMRVGNIKVYGCYGGDAIARPVWKFKAMFLPEDCPVAMEQIVLGQDKTKPGSV